MSFFSDYNNWMLIGLMFASGAMMMWPSLSKRASGVADIGTMNAIQLLNKENAVMLDVREYGKYNGVRIANALHCPGSDAEAKISGVVPKKERPVIIYDERGMRARSCAPALKKQGYTTIYHLQGGLKAWQEAGLPVEKI